MKIIDLLNKIANGEEVPNKFKLKGFNTDLVFCYNEKYNCYDLIGEKFENDCYVFGYSELNDTVEILEEQKKEIKPLTKKDIEALGYACGEIQKCFTNGWTKSLENKPLEEQKKIPEKLEKYYDKDLEEYVVETYINGTNYKEIYKSRYDEMIISKLNEIIDYLESKGE